MRLLWAFMLLSVTIAGCLTGGDDTDPGPAAERPAAGSLVCIEDVCNFQATIDPDARQANELSIAVNPLDPLNIVASGKDYTPSEAGDCVRDGIYVTFDGGATWENSNVPGSPWRLLDDPASVEPDGELSKFWCVTDPVVAFAPDGTLYWSIMPYQCDAASGSKTGAPQDLGGQEVGLEEGGLNDWFWTCSSMYVLVSEDGGRSFPVVREVAFGPRLEHDKQWMSVADDGTVLLCWDRDPNYQLLALVPQDNAAEQLTRPGYMVCATSQDKGRSWSDVVDVNPPADRLGNGGSWDGFLPWVDWDSNNNAWMAAIDAAGNVLVSYSPDGLQWDEPTIIGNYTNPPANGAFGWPSIQNSVFRVFTLPSMAVDRSGGPYDGHMYVTWMDHAGADAEALMAVFDGTQWSEPFRISDDLPDSGADQFMPVVNVGPDGTVDVSFFDRRDDPGDYLFTLYYTYSIDGGQTWAENLRVGEHLSDEQFSHHQNGMVFLGDYIDIDSSEGHAHVVWVDTRNEKADAFVATIARPSANA